MFITLAKPLRDNDSSFIVGVYVLVLIASLIIGFVSNHPPLVRAAWMLLVPSSIVMGMLLYNILVASYNLILILGNTVKHLFRKLSQ